MVLSPKHSIPGVLSIQDPASVSAIAVLVDSPHSGRIYPADFDFICDKKALQRYEDRYVDYLLANFTKLGATVITAQAARSYIDLNRANDDMCLDQLSDEWPGYLEPTEYTTRGIGLIWERVDGAFVYARNPSSADIQARIDKYYRPYYAALEDRAARLKNRFGVLYHLNVHSMPPETNRGVTDIVLGDLNGQSCSAEFHEMLADAFGSCNLRVGHNTPYKGARLTELFGWPAQRSESVQIEINKALYLQPDLLTIDEDKFAVLQNKLENVLKIVGNYAASKTPENVPLRAASRSAIETRLPSAASEVTP